ncbi:hypothetical protein AVEN_246813-1 [Araneus ventricosus]|uniref:Uncharacterized protein n=1 Tax=Araneus ventricosus TaxID=182803 RepID=A0A4Y2FRQ3_ARAVE|nr:hypothetical protein AVEN_246813-1 [Araneus ventricosus]
MSEKSLVLNAGESINELKCIDTRWVVLSTGVIGNSKANSHQVLEIGTQTKKSLIGSNFGDIKQPKKNVVLPLACVSSAIQMNNETVVVDPLIIFERTTITKKNDEDVADFYFLVYEVCKEKVL